MSTERPGILASHREKEILKREVTILLPVSLGTEQTTACTALPLHQTEVSVYCELPMTDF
ncbi:hypothetical protein [Vibrio sp. VGrn 2]|uniref:hypothetical protein n=1 Tax=Vibrio sp. VGrn 2 TaxID=2419839 RepID=UPI001D0D1603|nr:hypothetical protein [Vibrio sp. VGrn 2]